MINIIDIITKYISNAIDFLLLYNPLYTALGIILGGIFAGMRDFISTYISNISKIPKYVFVLFGVFVFNFPSIIVKRRMSPEIEQKIKDLQALHKHANITEQEKRTQWRNLITTVIESGNNDSNPPTNRGGHRIPSGAQRI